MLNYDKLETRFWLKAELWGLAALYAVYKAINNAYICGNMTKCKQLNEEGYNPEEIFQETDA